MLLAPWWLEYQPQSSLNLSLNSESTRIGGISVLVSVVNGRASCVPREFLVFRIQWHIPRYFASSSEERDQMESLISGLA